MRRFELIDGETRGTKPCGMVLYDPAKQRFFAHIHDGVSANEVPAVFSFFVARGVRDIPSEYVRAWVDERIAPPTRQNIGEILRAHDLDEYDPCVLLASGEGRSSQDGFYLREIGIPFEGSRKIGRLVSQARVSAGLTQKELSDRTGISQEVLSRIERGSSNPTAKTLERIAKALDKRLSIAFL